MTREEAVALLERYSNYEGMGIPNLAGCKEAMKVAAEALKEAYPELAESEDERIRKALINALKTSKSVGELKFVLPEPTREECIAYLEKQRESLHIPETSKENANSFTDEDERIRRWLYDYFSTIKEMIWIHRDITCEQILDWLEKQKECVSNNFDDVWDEEDCEEIIAEGQKLTPRFKELLKEVCHAWYDRGAKLEKQKEQKHPNGCFTCDEYKKGYEEGRRNGFTAGYNKAMKEVEQKEQKPAEWGEEETKLLDSIIDDYEAAAKSFCGYDGKIGLLRAIRDGEYDLPKQEWSEEDENVYKTIIDDFNGITPMSKAYKLKAAKWLKSFRPQYHGDVTMTEAYKMGLEAGKASSWKPSEEQMKALSDACCIAFEEERDFHPSLSRLYHDLRKL